MTPKQMVELGEEAEEVGGYFICNGIERLIRLLLMQRRNYVCHVSELCCAACHICDD